MQNLNCSQNGLFYYFKGVKFHIKVDIDRQSCRGNGNSHRKSHENGNGIFPVGNPVRNTAGMGIEISFPWQPCDKTHTPFEQLG